MTRGTGQRKGRTSWQPTPRASRRHDARSKVTQSHAAASSYTPRGTSRSGPRTRNSLSLSSRRHGLGILKVFFLLTASLGLGARSVLRMQQISEGLSCLLSCDMICDGIPPPINRSDESSLWTELLNGLDDFRYNRRLFLLAGGCGVLLQIIFDDASVSDVTRRIHRPFPSGTDYIIVSRLKVLWQLL